MKKFLSLVVTICVLLTIFTVPGFAATKLTSAETNIVKAFQKTLETNDLQYLNKYKYPGMKFYLTDAGADMDCKILNPQYSKVYDSKEKLNKLTIKGLLVATDGENLAYGNVTYSIFIKTKSSKLYAYKQAPTAKLKQLTLDDLSDSTIAAMEKYLISLYDEDTAYALMYPEENSEDEYSDDSDVDNGDDQSSSGYSGKANFNSPVPMNQKFTWSETKKYLDDTVSGTYSVTVKNVKKIDADGVEALGFRRPQESEDTEFALVDIVYEVKNATIKKGTGQGYAYLSSAWDMNLWGVKTSSGMKIIGGTDYGFDGSLSRVIDDANFKKVTPGMNESYKAEGKILLTLYKGKTNYMVLQNEEIYQKDDYDGSFMYFKLN